MNSLQNTNFYRTMDISLIGFVWNKVARGIMTFFIVPWGLQGTWRYLVYCYRILCQELFNNWKALTCCGKAITSYWNTVLILLNSEQTPKGMERKNLINLPVTITVNATKKQTFSLRSPIFGITVDLVHCHTYLAISNNVPISSCCYLSAIMMIR